ncbi:MAG TPA: hypothetical protein VGM51_01365 [Armatimonadota bacterium]|jgi:hypothetical protein
MRYVCLFAAAIIGAPAWSVPAAPMSALARMPVKEITVFKDGHDFVLHEGKMPTDAYGNVVMDYLPTPILGAFWPYSSDPAAKLTAVTARQRRVLVEHTALTPRDLIEANPGAKVGIYEDKDLGYGGEITGVPTRSSDELAATDPPGAAERLPETAAVVLIKTVEGTTVLPFDRIKEVTFKGEFKKSLAQEEFRNLLTLKLDWGGKTPAKTADVGMIYVQKGVRWIPSYKISVDGKGTATIKFQATLVNELTDLDDATVNLVIGVPTFAFSGTPDPISLQQTFAQLGQYFDQHGRSNYGLSNAIMTQAAGFTAGQASYSVDGPAEAQQPEVAGSVASEDLYVFTVKHVTLRRGERMVLPVEQYTVKYKDVYALDIPFAPPPEIRGNNVGQDDQVAKLLAAPKFMHKIRFEAPKDRPFTTSPALILSGDSVLGQGTMTYTAPGAETDLAITTAVDIGVKKKDKETARTPNAANWNGDIYSRIDLAGTITITNRHGKPVDLEIVRNVLGNVGTADNHGVAEMLNVFENDSYMAGNYRPSWWGYYNWPGWWYHFNGVGSVTWKLTLDTGKSVDLGYTWNYYWR